MCTTGGASGMTRATQILDVSTLAWTVGGVLPNDLAYSGHVNLQGTTLAVGGWSGVYYYDTILEWSPDTLSWFPRAETFTGGRKNLCAVMVDDELADCE